MRSRSYWLDLFKYFFSRYKSETFVVIIALLIAGLVETLGISAMFPLLGLIMGEGEASSENALQKIFVTLFDFLDIELSIEILLISIVLLISVKSVILFLAMERVSFISADVARDFQMQLISALMQARWSYFSGISAGVISNAIASESQRVGFGYLLACKTVSALIQALIYFIAAFLVISKLSIIAIAVAIVMGLIFKQVIDLARRSGAELSKTSDSLLSGLNESLSGAKPLKAMGQEDRYCKLLANQTLEVVSSRKKLYTAALLMRAIYEPALAFCLACGIYYALVFAEISAIEILLIAFISYKLFSNIHLVQSHYQNLVQNEGAIWSLEEQIKAAESVREISSGSIAPQLKSDIVIENLAVKYDGSRYVLENFNARIPAHAVTVIYGDSGSGKTTFIDALVGLLPANSGRILVDGVDLTEIDMKLWRQKIGYVLQDTFLFHDTVRQNITLGDLSFSDEDIFEALRKAAAFDFVMQLEHGLDTVVGERGGKLSGGQRQRLAIARAVIRNPDLLILDEPTSALDDDNRKIVLDVVKKLSSKLTIVMISHDHMSLEIADNTINVKAGSESAA